MICIGSHSEITAGERRKIKCFFLLVLIYHKINNLFWFFNQEELVFSGMTGYLSATEACHIPTTWPKDSVCILQINLIS